MSLKLNSKYIGGFVPGEELDKIAPEAEAARRSLLSGNCAGNDYLGWIDLPVNYDRDEFSRIKAAAEKIRKTCDVFIAIGIGGSYLGARAAIEFVKSPFHNKIKNGSPEVYFAGNGLNTEYLNELLEICEGKDVCVNVISKSGTTTEPAVAFRVFRDLLEKKYGKEGARERIFVTTDRQKGKLKELSDRIGYETFVVPDDVGGRYSVLTAVGLLPIAVAGVDIDALMDGAAEMRKELLDAPFHNNPAMLYAAYRNVLYRSGKKTEILVSYDPALLMFNEWWKQLFGESEGKDGKGLYPASAIFSADLHSLGQYIQQGERNLIETVIDVQNDPAPFIIPEDPENSDGLNFLAGKTLHEVNKNAFLATVIAHTDGGVPNLIVEIDSRSERSLGGLIWFFEFACAVSGLILGINPFNQPGVEDYKKNMFALLGKPGEEHEQRRKELLKMIY